MKRFCFALDLNDDPALIAEYEGIHKQIWPEIKKSITDAGITVMDIYRVGDRMFMIMETTDEFEFENKERMDASNPIVQNGKSSCGNFKSHFLLPNQVRNGCLWSRYFNYRECMKGIDSHQHFWKFDPVRDSWIDERMATIQRDFYPADLKPLLTANALEGSVVVQSDQSEAENVFQLANADKKEFVKGVVGWVDLQADNVHDRLGYYSQFKKMKGFRHVLQGEKQRDFMLRPAFKRGIGELHAFGFTYDILIFPDQLSYHGRIC